MHRQLAIFVFALVIALASVGVVVLLWSSQPLYFPRSALDESSNNWYSRHLSAMDEPVLKASPDIRTYRFTWLRTFHHPVAVRITYANSKAQLVAVELDGAGGYSPGAVLRRKDISLSMSQFAAAEQLIERSGFWDMPTAEKAYGRDGAEWIVEGAASRYHVATRWTPASGPARDIGVHFLSLTGWEFPVDETY